MLSGMSEASTITMRRAWSSRSIISGKVSGGAPVVLVSLTDMALKTEDTIIPYKNIPAIRDAQKKAAVRSGVIFWDAWESMGGKGSIVRWSKHIPPLASKDLTHLSNAGADTIASRIYSDLLTARTMAAGMPPDTSFRCSRYCCAAGAG